MNTIGKCYKLTLIGSSHGNLVGVIIEGIPANEIIDCDFIQLALDRRAPGRSNIATKRKENDKLIVECGMLKNRSTGEPFVAFVRNYDADSIYYEKNKFVVRPGHSDYPAAIKYREANDYRGGGMFSGRMTIGLVIAGSIALKLLNRHSITVQAYSREIGRIDIPPNKEQVNDNFIYSNNVRIANAQFEKQVTRKILEIKKQGDSVGGIIECQITGLPIGIGEPIFDSLEGKISKIIFGIPATKGIEFGAGFTSARMVGSENNDQYVLKDGKIVTRTNNSGGVLGGMSTGMPLIFRIAFKPTSSISKNQSSVNVKTKEEVNLKIKGRHDPCIVPRAVIVVQMTAAVAILDLMMQGGYFK